MGKVKRYRVPTDEEWAAEIRRLDKLMAKAERAEMKAAKVKGSAIIHETSRTRAVITGLARPSENTKTGAMAQTFILKREYPSRDVKGAGCDGCPVWDECYVNWGQAPASVHRAAEADRYAYLGADEKASLASVPLRVGSAGEPTAIPAKVWTALLKITPNWTGYTHKWRLPQFQQFKEFCMASVHSVAEAKEAWAMGWRTYRAGGEPEPDKGEIQCPHYTRGVQCADCGLCKGAASKAKSIWTEGHGTWWKD